MQSNVPFFILICFGRLGKSVGADGAQDFETSLLEVATGYVRCCPSSLRSPFKRHTNTDKSDISNQMDGSVCCILRCGTERSDI